MDDLRLHAAIIVSIFEAEDLQDHWRSPNVEQSEIWQCLVAVGVPNRLVEPSTLRHQPLFYFGFIIGVQGDCPRADSHESNLDKFESIAILLWFNYQARVHKCAFAPRVEFAIEGAVKAVNVPLLQ